MSYGNKNAGLLICRALDLADGSPVEGATVILTWVEGDSSFGGRLPLYDVSGKATDAPSAETDSSGVAFVQFLWDPTNIGWLNDSSPRVRVSAVGPAAHYSGWFSSSRDNKLYYTSRVGNEQMYECINLGAVYSGGAGDFQFSGGVSKALDVAQKIKQILEFRAKVAGEKIPRLPMFKVMRPSVEMVALLGGFDIPMEKQSS